ncbi:MAG: DUF427 domain-containing protein [Candidatus Scalindua sp. AMX11]|nr:MAG: DUF427 domain-containing protein [Candidatus Scalindua sp.]NOG84916.1 DUF427 domain-containing protein [Planctomycetota bacterium]RZV84981.1 MAG: DUF427 domain-containing protein [Candidatus Scalindua sp. SCAELEC01]TDE65025.1 MAG: DUF427 domain-containing protein [Candidatus Scalindua sp. AMX11]GJQ59418.1 MAG: hypothetical protein SCALA701_22190 [Candidatus Scalindua sp.]
MKPLRIKPGPGQESVWDYPRPPRLEAFSGHIKVILNGVTIADTRGAMRVLETSHPPVYYIPPTDIHREYIFQCSGTSYCEWKRLAHYFTIVVGQKSAEKTAWYYPYPSPEYSAIKDFVAFYPGFMDACYFNGLWREN